MGSYLAEASTTLRSAEEEFADRRMSVSSRQFHHGQAQLYVDLENATQARVSNLLILAGLQVEGSSAAAREAAILLNVCTDSATGADAAAQSS